MCTVRNTILIQFNHVLWSFYYRRGHVLRPIPSTNRGGWEGFSIRIQIKNWQQCGDTTGNYCCEVLTMLETYSLRPSPQYDLPRGRSSSRPSLSECLFRKRNTVVIRLNHLTLQGSCILPSYTVICGSGIVGRLTFYHEEQRGKQTMGQGSKGGRSMCWYSLPYP